MQLKTRVWDTVEKRFLANDDYCLTADGKIWLDPNSTYACHEATQSRYIVSYSIGLTDKNKHDLYSGDIVKWIAQRLFEDETNTYIGVIQWNNEVLRWEVAAYLKDGKYCNRFEIYPSKAVDNEQFERLGNKFQNEELLKAAV